MDRAPILEQLSALADPTTIRTMWSYEWSKQVVERALTEVARSFEPKTFEAFELYGRRDVPVETVAEQLAMSPDAIRQAKSRVARALREAIERIRDAEG